MRKLASIQVIQAMNPIPGYDKVALASVLGWQVIVRYQDFKVGDPCIYVEVDSLLPERPEFEFMRDKDFRVKTIRMCKTISQGICFPLSILPEGHYEIDDDVTEILGIIKWEPKDDAEEQTDVGPSHKKKVSKFKRFMYKCPLTNGLAHALWGNSPQRKAWPDFIAKTDETRIQTIPWRLDDKSIKYEVHEKIDGQSATYFLVKNKKFFGLITDYEFGVCSRNLRIFRPNNSSYWRLARFYNIREVLQDIMEERYPDSQWIAIQGEAIGYNIQGNKYAVGYYDLFCFNLVTEKNGRIDSLKAEPIVGEYGLKWVPLVAKDYVLPDTIQELEEFSHGKSVLHDTDREGLVFRSYDYGISFKCVDPLFLLKWRE